MRVNVYAQRDMTRAPWSVYEWATPHRQRYASKCKDVEMNDQYVEKNKCLDYVLVDIYRADHDLRVKCTYAYCQHPDTTISLLMALYSAEHFFFYRREADPNAYTAFVHRFLYGHAQCRNVYVCVHCKCCKKHILYGRCTNCMHV